LVANPYRRFPVATKYLISQKGRNQPRDVGTHNLEEMAVQRNPAPIYGYGTCRFPSHVPPAQYTFSSSNLLLPLLSLDPHQAFAIRSSPGSKLTKRNCHQTGLSELPFIHTLSPPSSRQVQHDDQPQRRCGTEQASRLT